MAGKESENGIKGFQMRKQETRTKWQRFQKAVYDPSTQQFLGRNGKSWAQLLTFYAIFYIVLAALFAICMQGLLATLDERAPKWKLDRSLIGSNPGMAVRPTREGATTIQYDTTDNATSEEWVNILDTFFKPYKSQTGENYKNCFFNKTVEEGHVCIVDLSQFGPCGPEQNYGYYSGSPCVFLKLNRIYGWVPEYFTTPQEGMPPELVEKVGESNETQYVWVSCQGKTEEDRKSADKFQFFPNSGFPSYYFPYQNTVNYLSPLVAVQIVNPKPNVQISIECRAWAQNIHYSGSEKQREGSVVFVLRQDAPPN